jgi:hypothetical protein
MPTYKNIRIPKRGGGTRTQRVQVLASGKYKFVKNLTTKRKTTRKTSSKKKRRRKTVAKKKNYRSRAKGIIGKYGMGGLLEDSIIGLVGSSMLMSRGYPLESALPMTRLAQGAIGKAIGRRGAGRLEYAVIDLIDVYLIRKGLPTNGIKLSQWL